MTSNGHDPEKVLDYSVEKFFSFIHAIQKNKRNDQADYLHATAIASQGDGDAIDKALKALQKD